jgi:hypothetical protein
MEQLNRRTKNECARSAGLLAMHALPARSYPGITQRASDPLPPPSGERVPLTELSNVVAYVCRRSHDEDRHHVQFVPQTNLPGFRVGIDQDGSVRRMSGGSSIVPAFG